jgi:hypothetical protein
MLIWQVLVLIRCELLFRTPCLHLGEYRTAPSGGGLLVPENLNQHYDNALVLCPRTKLYRQPPVYYYRQHSTST